MKPAKIIFFKSSSPLIILAIKYRELKDPVEINNFMKKWKEQNE